MLDSLDNPGCRDVCGKLWKGLRSKLRETHYTHCVILAGTNDVGGCKGSAEDIFKNIGKLANVAKDLGCETFVMTIPELREEKNHRNMEQIRIRANHLLMQSESLNSIDLSNVVPYHRLSRTDRDRMWEPDGLHLRPAGYNAIARAVVARLKGARVPQGAGDAPPVGMEGVGSDPRHSSKYPLSSARISPAVAAPAVPTPCRPKQPLAVNNNLQQHRMPTGGAAPYAKITKTATPSLARPAGGAPFENPGQVYLRFNVPWTPEEYAGKKSAQSARELMRAGYAPMTSSPSGSPMKKILSEDETMPDIPNEAHHHVAADSSADGFVHNTDHFSPERPRIQPSQAPAGTDGSRAPAASIAEQEKPMLFKQQPRNQPQHVQYKVNGMSRMAISRPLQSAAACACAAPNQHALSGRHMFLSSHPKGITFSPFAQPQRV
jgi:hypothetical protein